MKIGIKLNDTIKSMVGKFEIVDEYRNDSIRTGVIKISSVCVTMFIYKS